MSLKNKRHLVLYEIYPRSFQDSNGDGFGDLPGITSRLDYLVELGINAIWITPFFPSPMKDVGYDVSDYYAVAKEFGTLTDFKKLVQQAYKRGIAVIIDLVINHTSDKHPWFQESRSSKTNPKRDWYLWHDPVDGKAPNNWKSVFDPSVWEFDKTTGQYYFHSFLKEQPDLNWANPEIMAEVKKIISFWLELGVDGFRVDAINHVWKNHLEKDQPKNSEYDPQKQSPFHSLQPIYMRDQEELYGIVEELSAYIDEQKALLITEAYPPQHGIGAIQFYKKYYDHAVNHSLIPFNFELLHLPWEVNAYEEFLNSYLKSIEEEDTACFVLGNHDRPRVGSRLGQERLKACAVLLLTLPGMPVVYYGEELGMEDVRPIPKEMVTDTKELRSPGFGRDQIRTPMQWDGTKFAGFSNAKPWLPLEKVFTERNVDSQKKDPRSLWRLYQTLLTLRKQHKNIFVEGSFSLFEIHTPNVLSYIRSFKDETYLILINFSSKPIQLPNMSFKEVILRTEVIESNAEQLVLQANEACIIKM